MWVRGKTVWSPCYTRAISERFRDKGLIIKRYVNSSSLLLLYCYIFINTFLKPLLSILFLLPRFPPLQSGASFSTPAISAFPYYWRRQCCNVAVAYISTVWRRGSLVLHNDRVSLKRDVSSWLTCVTVCVCDRVRSEYSVRCVVRLFASVEWIITVVEHCLLYELAMVWLMRQGRA